VIALQSAILCLGRFDRTVFAWRALVKWLIASIGRRDYPVATSGILHCRLYLIVVNLLSDITYGM